MERTESAPSTTENAPQRSRTPAAACAAARTPNVRNFGVSASSTKAYGMQMIR